MLLVLAVIFSLFFTACSGGPKGDGVWIPIPKDTSELGIRDHFISRKEIDVYRKRYDQDRDSLAIIWPNLYVPKSEAFNKKSLLEVLKDSNCIGIRIYYGATARDEKGDFRLIIVGVDKEGKDLFIKKAPGNGGVGDDGEGGLEYGQCDPPCYGPPPPPPPPVK
jgi:hypothetical protein